MYISQERSACIALAQALDLIASFKSCTVIISVVNFVSHLRFITTA